MAVILPIEEPWTSQPQVATFAPSAIVAILPIADSSAKIFDYSGRSGSLSFFGSAPSGGVVTTNGYGKGLKLHPSGGANGIVGITCPQVFNSFGDNFSVVAGGKVTDTSYIGWASRDIGPNIFGFAHTSSTLAGYYADTNVNTATATISGLSVTVGSYQRCAFRKSGAKIDVFDWRSKKTATATNTASGFYSGSSGKPVIGDLSVNELNFWFLIPGSASDGQVWGWLDNPWQIFAP